MQQQTGKKDDICSTPAVIIACFLFVLHQLSNKGKKSWKTGESWNKKNTIYKYHKQSVAKPFSAFLNVIRERVSDI